MKSLMLKGGFGKHKKKKKKKKKNQRTKTNLLLEKEYTIT